MPTNGTEGLQFFDLSHPWGHDAPLWPYFPDVKIERFHYHAKSGVLSQQITTFMHCTTLHVAARTDMPHCKGRMFEWFVEWWFRFAPDSYQYAWWHPIDHVSSEWVETSAMTHVGSTHLVSERLGGEEVYPLQIHFIDPAELFGDAYAAARDRGDISAIVAAQIGIGSDPLRDDRGRPNNGRMAHICRDTPDGMVLRSRFWL